MTGVALRTLRNSGGEPVDNQSLRCAIAAGGISRPDEFRTGSDKSSGTRVAKKNEGRYVKRLNGLSPQGSKEQ